jgi:hypothetical protein
MGRILDIRAPSTSFLTLDPTLSVGSTSNFKSGSTPRIWIGSRLESGLARRACLVGSLSSVDARPGRRWPQLLARCVGHRRYCLYLNSKTRNGSTTPLVTSLKETALTLSCSEAGGYRRFASCFHASLESSFQQA